MAKAFYLKLARGNLTRNKRMYGPYCVAAALMSGIFFIILNLVYSKSIANLSYGGTVQAMFTIGIGVMTFFTVGYMLYINSFLIKRRKKEFGLYGVLGMERRHVVRVILWENLILNGASLLLGLIGGCVFGRLVFLLLMEMLDTAKGSVYMISGGAMSITVIIFLVIFVLTTLYNLNQVRLATPVDLLKGGQKGEKKTRFVIPMTLLGFAALGVAYRMAITTKNPAVALMQFWPAVILVIIATWLLFTGGSVFILNTLKRNKRIYYRPRNFIAISGLIHRMKQNAAGLANICILSTMVMVTVSCCCALFLGQSTILRRQNPDDINLSFRVGDAQIQQDIARQTREAASALAAAETVSIEAIYEYRFFQQNVLFKNEGFTFYDENGFLARGEDENNTSFFSTYIIPLADYNSVTGSEETLAPGEILLLSSESVTGVTEIPADGGGFHVKKHITDSLFTKAKNSVREQGLYFIVADQASADRMARLINPTQDGAWLITMLAIDVTADHEAGFAFATALRDTFRGLFAQAEQTEGLDVFYRTTNIFENRMDGYSLYGGLLFLGVFFALLFLINTVLIIYFKQISEGFDDSERFAILQKVGLSDAEVRATINRQMLIVFMLPLVVALVHIAAASNMIMQMLGTFMLTDFALTMTCVVVTAAVFVVVYLCVYRITARTYYRLVKW